MRSTMKSSTSTLLCLAAALLAAGDAGAIERRTAVWDTGKPAAAAPADLSRRDGWRLVAPDTAGYAFQGDAVIENDRLQVLCGKQAGPPVVYSRSGVGQGPKRMGLLVLDGKREACAAITSMSIVENDGDQAMLELSARGHGGQRVRTRIALATGGRFVELRPVENAAAVHACAPSRFVAVPDFFGDDMLFDARRSPAGPVYVPAENIVLNFTGAGDTILMTVWPQGDQEVQALAARDPANPQFEALEFTFDNKSLFFAVLDTPGIWHSVALDRVRRANEDLPAGWKKPFEARWRGDVRLARRTDSWEFESRRREKCVVPPFGQIVWPFWFDRDQAMIRPVAPDYLGVALIYPLERRSSTPLAVFTPVDILRETLGTGPCEYILDREGVGTRTPGGARHLVSTGVCNTTGRIQHFFERGLECREQKIIGDMADDVQVFNVTVRARLGEYKDFGRHLAQLCREELRRNPAVRPVAQRAEQLESRLDTLFRERLAAMRTPQDNVVLVGQLKELTRSESPENLGRYLSVAAQLRALASAQDTLAALCRCEVRLFRREVGLIAASDRSVAKFADKLRELARNALRKKHYTEGA